LSFAATTTLRAATGEVGSAIANPASKTPAPIVNPANDSFALGMIGFIAR